MIAKSELKKENTKLKVTKKRIQDELESLKPCKSGVSKSQRNICGN